jgi:hypothetical protein
MKRFTKPFPTVTSVILFILVATVFIIKTSHSEWVPANPYVEKKLLIAFFSRPTEYDRRGLIRTALEDRLHPSICDLVFVLNEKTPLVIMEQHSFGDLIVRDNVSIADGEETLDFFRHLYRQQQDRIRPSYDYIIKLETDSFVHIENLMQKLQSIPDHGVYLGRSAVNSEDEGLRFMSGMGYVVSGDVAQDIAVSTYPIQTKMQFEDVQIGNVIANLGRKVNYISEEEDFADHPRGHNGNKKTFSQSAIVVHACREDLYYMHSIRHFYPEEFQTLI